MTLVAQGGWVFVAIFALSFLGWFLIVCKWLGLRRETEKGREWIEPVVICVRRGRIADAKAACRNRTSAVARIMLTVIDRLESTREYSRKQRRKLLERESKALKRHLNLIAAAGAALPLLGLLGTVQGLMQTFAAMTGQGEASANDLVTGGIAEALITTQAGLVAALPIVLMHGLLSSRIRRELERCALAVKRVNSAIEKGE